MTVKNKARVEGAVGDLGAASMRAWPCLRELKVKGNITGKVKVKVKQQVSKAAETVTGKIQEATGSVKPEVGERADDDSMRLEGDARELEGWAGRALERWGSGG